nr:transposon Ty3-G Gag-Pol polyprotein [Tanacetum cinerariifolium]
MDIELCIRGTKGYGESLKIEPNLILRIKEAQKEDASLWAMFPKFEEDEQTKFRVDDDGVMWFGDRLRAPSDPTLQEAVLSEAHSSSFSIHPGSCLICQQVKIEHQRESGLLQPLDIPVWKWDEISMDFETRLPRTQKKNDAIWVVVDRLTKSAHFLPIHKDFSISRLADIFQREIIRLDGTPAAIVSDRDPRFTQNRRDLPKDTPIDRLEVLRYDIGKRSIVRTGIMSTETELTLEQTQQVMMEILLEPTSNKLFVGDVGDSIRIELVTLGINLGPE